MNQIERQAQEYGELLRRPQRTSLAAPERVLFVVHDAASERRVTLRLSLFEQATIQAGWIWHVIDVSSRFGQWMDRHEYKDAYFEQPELAEMLHHDFSKDLVNNLSREIAALRLNERTVVAVTGTSALFGLMKMAALVSGVESLVPGRLLVFFPGQYDRERGQFRFLDARDGWNYHAIPITGDKGLGV